MTNIIKINTKNKTIWVSCIELKHLEELKRDNWTIYYSGRTREHRNILYRKKGMGKVLSMFKALFIEG